jgi:hypothetical protein
MRFAKAIPFSLSPKCVTNTQHQTGWRTIEIIPLIIGAFVLPKLFRNFT